MGQFTCAPFFLCSLATPERVDCPPGLSWRAEHLLTGLAHIYTWTSTLECPDVADLRLGECKGLVRAARGAPDRNIMTKDNRNQQGFLQTFVEHSPQTFGISPGILTKTFGFLILFSALLWLNSSILILDFERHKESCSKMISIRK